MRNWIWLGLAVPAAGLVWAWSLATASTEVSSIDGPQGKLAPHFWQEWKWSFPDDQWNPEDADAAEREARLHAQSQASRVVEGTWTQHGPLNLSGRLNAIYEDTNPLSPRMFAGSAGGGLWRSTTGGAIWEPVTDEFEHMAVGCMAFHPETPEVMYVGTGDPQISGHPRIGGGAYKSVDGGTTWTHIGLEDTRIVSRIELDPFNPNVLFAATMGNPGMPGPDRGLYRSQDAGETWEQVLFVGDSVGINDVRISSVTGAILASSWHRIRTSTTSDLVSPDNQVYRSLDGGETWDVIPNPWGEEERCRIGIEESQGRFVINPVGANLQFSNLYRTGDDGNTWAELVPEGAMPDGILGGFGWYFSKVRLNPWDFNDISVLGVELWNTLDGGVTWERMGPEWWTYEVHADKHDLQWVGPNELILATDGGAYRSTDHGDTWEDIEHLPVGQFYHVTHIPWAPGWYTAGAQDNGTTTGNASVAMNWSRDRGGDGFTALYHPEDPALRVATVQYANFAYSLTEWDQEPEWNSFTDGIDPEDREPWDAPILFHPANPDVAWCGTQRVYRMNGSPFGVWQPVSEDLTLGEGPGLGFRVITTMAGSPFNEDVVAAGTSDGQVWYTANGGVDWNLMTAGLPQRQVTDIAFDPFHADSMTVTLNGYKDAVYTPHVFRAAIGGIWNDVTGDLPDHPANDWRALNDSTWVIATDYGVYHTTNWGQHWERVGDMPFISVFELDVDTAASQLVAATFARSIQTFPLDSLLPEPAVEEPVDTSVIAVGEMASPVPACLRLMNHPFGSQGTATLDPSWLGGQWTVYDWSGKTMASGVVQTNTLTWDMQGWPSGGHVIQLSDPRGTTCSTQFIKAAMR